MTPTAQVTSPVRALVVTGRFDRHAPIGPAGRFYTLVEELARRADVELALVSRRKGRIESFAGVPESRISLVPFTLPLQRRTTPAGRVARIAHFAVDPLPLFSVPRFGGLIAGLARECNAEIVVTLGPILSHLLLALPSGLPAVAVLDEGIDRYPDPYLHLNDSLLRRWMRAAEARKVRRLYSGLASRDAHAVAISPVEADWFARFMPPRGISVIPHGVDLDHWRPASSRKRDIDVLVVGDLADSRNAAPLLDVFDAVERIAPRPLRWAMVGKEPVPGVVALRSDRVEVTGFVADARPFYERARVAVVPARNVTGTKTTLLQAWAMGTPVVATRASTLAVRAVPGENVLVGEDAGEVAERVCELLADSALQARLSAAGRRTVEADHDLVYWSERLAELCVGLARAGGGPGTASAEANGGRRAATPPLPPRGDSEESLPRP